MQGKLGFQYSLLDNNEVKQIIAAITEETEDARKRIVETFKLN